ncbi:MAG: pentapeptide repeat-containing protein [Planctomycetes bacterium]|nr:pentapeptide repeat-containing protein [Planctomycetota bacterium]
MVPFQEGPDTTDDREPQGSAMEPEETDEEQFAGGLGPKVCDAAGTELCTGHALSEASYCWNDLRRRPKLFRDWWNGFLSPRLKSDPPDLSDLWLEHVDFSSRNLDGARFSKSQMVGARFDRCSLGRASFAQANVSRTTWEQAILARTDFGQASLARAKFYRTQLFERCLFNDACAIAIDLNHVHAVECDFSGADLRSAIVERTYFERCRMRKVIAEAATFYLCGVRESELEHTTFRSSKLFGIDFTRSKSLANCVFDSADITAPVVVSQSSNAGAKALKGQRTHIRQIIKVPDADIIPSPLDDALNVLSALIAFRRWGGHLKQGSPIQEKIDAIREARDRVEHHVWTQPFALRAFEHVLGESTDGTALAASVALAVCAVAGLLLGGAASWALPPVGVVCGGAMPHVARRLHLLSARTGAQEQELVHQ